MITVDILDSLGATIGSLSFPDGTDTATIDAALALYTVTSPITPINPDITAITLSGTGQVTTSAGTPTVVSGMTIKPISGTYIVQFSGSVNTNGSSASGTFGFYVDGTLLSETNRPISCNLSLLGGLVTVSINAIGVGTYTGTQVTLNGTQTLDVRFSSTNGGTIGFNERVLTLIKVS